MWRNVCTRHGAFGGMVLVFSLLFTHIISNMPDTSFGIYSVFDSNLSVVMLDLVCWPMRNLIAMRTPRARAEV